jgi:hypothetical protein
MAKSIRIGLGSLLVAFGIIFFILPGSILFLLIGLTVLSYDVPRARGWLRACQNSAARGARKLDKIILHRKLR